MKRCDGLAWRAPVDTRVGRPDRVRACHLVPAIGPTGMLTADRDTIIKALPFFPWMSDQDVDDVAGGNNVIGRYPR